MLIQICNSQKGLYLVNELATMAEVFKEFAQQQLEGCSGFVFLKTYSDIFFECFVASASFGPFQTIDFKADTLTTCDSDLCEERLVS